MTPLQVAIIYWVLLLIYLVYHLVTSWPKEGAVPRSYWVGLIPFVLWGMLGWRVFSEPFK